MMPKAPLLLLFASLLCVCCGNRFDERCLAETRKFTDEQCPRQIDPATRLDSMIYELESRTISYNYTVSGELDNDTLLASDNTESFKEALTLDIIKSIELKPYKEERVNFCYRYYSQTSGRLLMEKTITPEDYNPPTPQSAARYRP